jgi:hypothetical protein
MQDAFRGERAAHARVLGPRRATHQAGPGHFQQTNVLGHVLHGAEARPMHPIVARKANCRSIVVICDHDGHACRPAVDLNGGQPFNASARGRAQEAVDSVEAQ